MPAKRAEARVLRPKQLHKQENTQPNRKLVQGRSKWRSVSRSTLLPGGRIGNATRRPCSARTKEREISRTVRGDVSTVRPHRSSFRRDYSFRHERPHFILQMCRGQNTIARGCASDATGTTIFWPEYLTKSGNPVRPVILALHEPIASSSRRPLGVGYHLGRRRNFSRAEQF